MKVVFIDWKCFDREETKAAFEALGHEVISYIHKDYNAEISADFDADFKKTLESSRADMVFSYNYFPAVALSCKDMEIPYISFLYDSPYTYIFSYTLAFPTNHVFLFDSSLAEYFQNGGLSNVHYMILPGVPSKMDRLLNQPYNKARLSADVSFVGALYNEAHNFFDRIDFAKAPYLEGYIRGVMDAQKKILGYNFVEELLTQDVLDELQRIFPVAKGDRSIETDGYRYADYFINRKITSEERIECLKAIGDTFGKENTIKLFTLDNSFKLPGIKNMGIAQYEDEMPYVFHDSRINLNISLRSIKTGIPLRCMDIMACGGFLLSNFQSDFLNHFTPGEDFDYYESKEDMLSKIDYYLSHEKERAEIAENGQQKVREYYSMENIMSQILDIAAGKG